MEHDLAPKIFQLFVANLATPRVLPQGCVSIPEEVLLGCDSRLGLKNFSHNLAVPELIKGSLVITENPAHE